VISSRGSPHGTFWNPTKSEESCSTDWA
jgi:hypothetical protein